MELIYLLGARLNKIDLSRLMLLLVISIASIFFYGGHLKAAVLVALALYLLTYKIVSSKLLLGSAIALIAVYPAFIAVIQVAHYINGDQGVDFGIFSQLIFQVASNNIFRSSLISTEWQNFLTHHFSPYLFLLGWIAKLGIPPEFMLIGIHSFSVIALAFGIYRLFRLFSEDQLRAIGMTFLVLLLPTVRIGLSWETHDEVLALPFLVWSLYAHFVGKDWIKLSLLLPTLLFKETLGLNIFGLSLFYALSKSRGRFPALIVGLIGISSFILYTYVFPHWLWTPSFEISGRVGGFAELLSLRVLTDKTIWLLRVFFPLTPFLLLHSRSSLKLSAYISLAAASNLAAIAITNVPNMYEPYNYYSITPAVMIFLGFTLPILRSKHILHCICLSLALLSFSGQRIRTRDILKEAFTVQSAQAEIRSIVSADQIVIADDTTISILSDQKQLIRVTHGKRMRSRFNYIVMRKEGAQQLARYLQTLSTPCAETSRFLIRCGVDKVKP